MTSETTETVPGIGERTHGRQAMPRETAAYYELHLRLCGLPIGGAEEVQSIIEAALAASAPAGQVIVQSVVERLPLQADHWVEEHIVPLSVLFCTVPVEFQKAAILTALSEHYHRELT